MRYYEFILNEDRTDFIAQAMKQRLEDAAQRDPAVQRFPEKTLNSVGIVQQLKAMDPDPASKNIQFLANMYAKNQFSLEDREKIRKSIATFLKYRNKLSVRDLNAIRDLNQLYDLIEPLEQQAQSQPEPVSQGQKEREIKSDAKKLIDTPNFKVIIPQTEEASCLYGKGTKWCTAAREDNRFYTYNSPLYIIITNIGGKTRKFQFHYGSDSFRNDRDQDITKTEIAALSKIPEYTQFLNYLIKLHAGAQLDTAQNTGKVA